MSDSTPAIIAGFSPCTPEQLKARELGLTCWFYQADGTTLNTQEQRLEILRFAIAARLKNLGTPTPAKAEDIDAALLSLWNGFSAAESMA